MAPKKEDKKKRRNKRKSRTEVSEISSSEDEAPVQTRPAPLNEAPQQDSDVEEENTEIAVPEKKVKIDVNQAFEDFYLRQATREFANDLDKLRKASDWKGEESLAMLVRGLKGGAKGFEESERMRVVG